MKEYFENNNKYRELEAADVKTLFPERSGECNKADFGYVALVGGSLEYSGAIRLAGLANAAARSGAGVVSAAVPREIARIVAGAVLECTVFPLSDSDGELVFNEEEFAKLCRRYKTIAFGMGIGNTDETLKALEYLLENYSGVLIVDADGLNAMSKLDAGIIKESGAKLVLTPHLKEFSRLSGCSIEEIKKNPSGLAKELAKSLGAIVLLKGAESYITDGEAVYINRRGCAGMATAGSGDVLSGILAAVCASNEARLLLAAAGGAWINGAAGELAQQKNGAVSMLAGDTAACIKDVILNL